MSAKDWVQCPQCLAWEKSRKLAMADEMKDTYGKVPREQYEKLVKEFAMPLNRTETMRVDYEIGVDEKGEFSCWFGVSCENCGYEFRFKHKQQTEIKIELTVG